ncbi:PREDICTED: heavy metal-associated isoprenylated plant protein 3-like [Camelina sativa]|uniref:Heavy metal-associated isoprenylated plant protein 3-like n=1 Tax=Camelina sativa TaxID=90675 RepID=A0ABM0WAA8_CAMSA|nr:PREDICTED: heavy metal-associated isoprenylated plant protein 3-like [Camelina sativa]
MGKNKQNGEADNKSEKKNQKNGDSSVDKSEKKNQKSGGDSSVDKSDKKTQCKEIVLKVYMHCEGCASQVSHCLRGYDGVEQIKTEIGNNKVVVSGKFDDPMKILRRVQNKFSKNAELISPKPNPKQDQKKEPQQKKETTPQIKTVILKMNMHCEGCVNEIKKGIGKIKGVQTVEPDRAKSTVVVRGDMDPQKLVEKIKKKLGKHAELASQTTEKSKENNNNKNTNKNQDSDGNKIFSYPPQYSSQHAYPSQLFSDENVHSCSIM